MIQDALYREKERLEKEIEQNICHIKGTFSKEKQEELLEENKILRYQRGFIRYLISLGEENQYVPRFIVPSGIKGEVL